MKELSIEEKAKRYDEAIKVAKSKIKNNKNHVLYEDDIIEIFPELKESEDERIRKEIIEQINLLKSATLSDLKDKQFDSWIAWLEKQGKHANFRNKIQIGDKVTRNRDGVLVNLSQLNRVAKPAAKVEPKFKFGDKIYLKPEYRMPDDDTPIANTVKEIIGINDEHYRFDGSYIFIEDQDKYELEEQKPAWSEEDEKQLNNIMWIIEAYRKNGFNEIHIQIADNSENWLKSIKDRVQPKQEWSEEDKDMIDKIIDYMKPMPIFFESTTGKSGKEYTKEFVKNAINWLKSLRPQNRWKPSDEQMEALWSTTEKYLESDNENVRKLRGEVLESLYEDLKKLREE